MRTTAAILLALVLGIAAGRGLPAAITAVVPDVLPTVLLALLVLCAGILLGSDRRVFDDLRSTGASLLSLPVAVALGSVAGGLGAALLTGTLFRDGLAVSFGFGWYSLSGVLAARLGNPGLGALAFLSNLVREMTAFLLIPLLSTSLGGYFCVGVAGATGMDTTLPVVSAATEPRFSALAFVSGAVLSALVPLLLPLALVGRG